MATVARFLGDSYTVGSGASSGATAWASLVSADQGWTQTNLAVSATQMVDQCAQGQAQPYQTIVADSVTCWLSGTNDMRYYGSANAAQQTTYKNALRCALAWLCRLDADKFQASNVAWTFTGSWTSETNAGIAMKKTTTSGDTASISVSGTAITVAYLANFSTGGTFTVSIDGSVVDTINASVGTLSAIGVTTVPMAQRYPNLAAGTHTVLITSTSTGLTQVAFVTGNGETTHVPIYIGGPPTLAVYSNFAPYDQGSDAAVTAYETAIQSVVSELAGDASRTLFVSVNTYWVKGTDISGDTVHPNDSGHSHIRDAFDARIAFVATGGVARSRLQLCM